MNFKVNVELDEFKALFLKTIKNQDNPFHPLVWINGNPKIGHGTYIGGFSEINAKGGEVVIGNNCDIASFVAINVADSHLRCIELSVENVINNIEIGDHVFIGSHSIILGGAVIGHHSVIGAGSVVRKCVIPPYSLVIGNPSLVKPSYFKEKYKIK